MNGQLDRKLPFSLEAEQSVLGAILIDPQAIDIVAGIISVDDFYLEEHKSIFSAMQKLSLQSRDIDPVVLMEALVQEGVYDIEQSKKYIRTIAEIVPSSSNIKDYAKIVKDKSTLRKLITACDEINTEAYEEASPVRTIIDSAEQKIFDISNNNDTKELRHISDILHNVYLP